jgi:hypothetical protein
MSIVIPTGQSAVEGIRQGSTKEHTMSSPIHTEPSRSRELEIAAECDQAQHERELRDANERPRRFRSTGRRRAAAVAIGFAVASAGFACAAVTPASQTGAAPTMSIAPAASSPVRSLHASASPRAFALAIHELETRGYAEAACTVKGMLMVNPRTHRSETVLYSSPGSELTTLGVGETPRHA